VKFRKVLQGSKETPRMSQPVPPEDEVDTPLALSLVIPTYNERHNVEMLLDELRQVFERHDVQAEVIVVDDNSPDGTGPYVEERCGREPWLRVVRRSGKLGLTSAVTAGFDIARGEIFGVMDADLSHPVSALPRMLEAMAGDVDFVIGSRYVDGGRVEGWPLSRWIMSRTACLLAYPFTPVRDSMSGLFLIRRSCVEGVELTARGFKIGLDLLVKANYRSVREVPITFVDRRYGESKVSRGEILNLLKSLGRYAIAGQTGRGGRT
jgi:dolichol-phosphate mannosyltransferase